jgi:hypothetical protein
MTLTESAFRRGVHQALDFASKLADQGTSKKGIQRRIAQAAMLAERLRNDPSRSYPELIDEIHRRLPKRPGDVPEGLKLELCSECSCPSWFYDNAESLVCDHCEALSNWDELELLLD